MATGTAMKIVRGIVGKNTRVYNDLLKDGTRSIKVASYCSRGWEIDAASKLAAMGIKAKIVTMSSGTKRLHVME